MLDIKFITGNVSIGKYIDVTSRYLFHYVYKKIAPYNIQRHQFKVLIELYNKEGIYQENIVDTLKIRKSEVAKAIKKLMDNGYIYKVKNPKNKKYHNLYLTEKGILIKPKLVDILIESNKVLTQKISEEDLEVTKRVLKQMSNNIYEETNKKDDSCIL